MIILAILKDNTKKQLFKPTQISTRNNFDDHWKHSIILKLHATITPTKKNALTYQTIKIITSHYNKVTITYKTQLIQKIDTIIPSLNLNTIINYIAKRNKITLN